MSRMNKSQMLEGTSIDPKSTKFIANNTLERTLEDGTKIVRHFNTDILTFKPDGTIVFNADGMRSMTTKSRMNELQEFVSISQRNHVWYVKALKQTYYGDNGQSFMSHDTDAEEFVYADGMTYHPDREFKNVGKPPSKKMIKALHKYSKDFVDKLPIEQPGAGDCWYCSMREKDTGIPIGDVHKDTTHLISHIFDDRYYVPSLLVNALEEAGRGDYSKACVFASDRYGYYYKDLLNSSRDIFKKDIYNYLYKRIINKQFSK